jgi:predicted amidohydrolase
MSLRAALLQLTTPDTHEAALAELEPLVRQAAADGAQFILTPEGSNILQRRRETLFERLRTQDDDPVVQGLCALARELNVWMLIGSALVLRPNGDGRAANRSLLIDDHGDVVATYDKLHMFVADLPTGESPRESDSYAPGEAAVAADTPWGRLGLSICYDIRFPGLYRRLAQAGATLFSVPSAFTRPTGEAHWEVLLRARAIENGAFVLAPAQGGEHADGRKTWGRSMVVDPWGTVIAQHFGDQPGVILADLELEAVERARRALPTLRHEREFAGP